MSVRTKTRRIKRAVTPKSKSKPRAGVKTSSKAKERSIPWREVFKEELEKYGQSGLMLRGSRHEAEMTQKELADALGISQNHISEMENGKRPIGKVMALRLAEVFGTDYRKFM